MFQNSASGWDGSGVGAWFSFAGDDQNQPATGGLRGQDKPGQGGVRAVECHAV